MSIFSDVINTVVDAGQGLISGGKGLIEDVSTWCNNLFSSVGTAIDSAFSGDIVGINANKIPDMINAIEEYINRINNHLNDIKTNTSTENAMKGEYAAAVRTYVGTACDVCYKIISQLRYFEDKLILVRDAYQQKDQNLSSTIADTSKEMESSWNEYQRQY